MMYLLVVLGLGMAGCLVLVACLKLAEAFFRTSFFSKCVCLFRLMQARQLNSKNIQSVKQSGNVESLASILSSLRSQGLLNTANLNLVLSNIDKSDIQRVKQSGNVKSLASILSSLQSQGLLNTANLNLVLSNIDKSDIQKRAKILKILSKERLLTEQSICTLLTTLECEKLNLIEKVIVILDDSFYLSNVKHFDLILNHNQLNKIFELLKLVPQDRYRYLLKYLGEILKFNKLDNLIAVFSKLNKIELKEIFIEAIFKNSDTMASIFSILGNYLDRDLLLLIQKQCLSTINGSKYDLILVLEKLNELKKILLEIQKVNFLSHKVKIDNKATHLSFLIKNIASYKQAFDKLRSERIYDEKHILTVLKSKKPVEIARCLSSFKLYQDLYTEENIQVLEEHCNATDLASAFILMKIECSYEKCRAAVILLDTPFTFFAEGPRKNSQNSQEKPNIPPNRARMFPPPTLPFFQAGVTTNVPR